MAPKIVMARHVFADVELAQKMLPDGFELVGVKPNSAEFKAAMADAKFLIGVGDLSMDDAFYRAEPEAEARAAPQRRLRPLQRRGREPRRRPDLQQRRRQRRRRRRARDHADAGGLQAADLAALDDRVRPLARQRLDREVQLYELSGRTLGIVGLGNIGKKVARIAQGASACRALQRHRAPERGRRATRSARAFACCASCCRCSDIVTLHVPLTDETRHMINAKTLCADAAHAVLDQHVPWSGGGRDGAPSRAHQRRHRRRPDRCVRRGTDAAEQSAVRARERGR